MLEVALVGCLELKKRSPRLQFVDLTDEVCLHWGHGHVAF